ncbi:MAG TPA: serine protease [Candidatus Paceibacterota bacterium]
MLGLANIFRIIFSIGIVTWLSIATFLNIPSDKLQEESLKSLKGEETIHLLNPVGSGDVATHENPEELATDTRSNTPLDLTEKEETSVVKDERPLAPTTPPVLLPEGIEFKAVNDIARTSVVNIVCEMRSDNVVKTVTGSGVLVDARGVIITNAHLAQFLLLKDYPRRDATRCVVRVGNPAQDKYEVELLYIPITWVQKNAHTIDEEDPSGTGEDDYALLRITKAVNGDDPLPQSFPHIPVNTAEEVVSHGEPVLIASYPALVANIDAIKNDLYLVSTVTQTGILYTFGDDLLDLFALNGTVTAQRGSSGGGVLNQKGELVGVIVTSTNDELVLNRELRALTPAYINRSLLQENGTSLAQLLFGDLALRAQAFKLITAPILTKLLVQAFN